MNEQDQALADYRALVREQEEVTAALEKAKQRLVELAAVKGQKSLSSIDGDLKIVATVSSRTITKFDEKGLKKALGAISYKRLCKLQIDKVKLEAAVQDGKVDPVLVAQYTVITQSAPYIRLSEKAVDDE